MGILFLNGVYLYSLPVDQWYICTYIYIYICYYVLWSGKLNIRSLLMTICVQFYYCILSQQKHSVRHAPAYVDLYIKPMYIYIYQYTYQPQAISHFACIHFDNCSQLWLNEQSARSHSGRSGNLKIGGFKSRAHGYPKNGRVKPKTLKLKIVTSQPDVRHYQDREKTG